MPDFMLYFEYDNPLIHVIPKLTFEFYFKVGTTP